MIEVGKRIRDLREKRGISVIELAEALHVSRATIYRYESNEIEKLPIEIVDPIAKALHVSPAYIMGWTDDDNTIYNYKADDIESWVKEPESPYITNSSNSEVVKKALELYDLYSKAQPQDQKIVEMILQKTSQPDP